MGFFDKVAKKLDAAMSGEKTSVQAVRTPPNRGNAFAHLDKGRELETAGQYEEALEEYTLCLEVSPEHLCYISRAYLYEKLGRLDEAMADCDKAIQLRSGEGYPHYVKGRICSRNGMEAEALKHFDKAIELSPDDASFYASRGFLYASIEHPGALSDYNKAISLNSKEPYYYECRARVHRQNGDLREAMEDCGKALDLDAEYDGAYEEMGHVLSDSNMHDDAADAYGKAIELRPGSAFLHYCRALEFQELEQPAQGMADMKIAIALKPDDPVYHSTLGDFFNDLGQYDDVARALVAAIEVDPERIYSYLKLSMIYWQQDMFDKALEYCDQGIGCDSGNPVAYSQRGSILGHMERYEEAVQSFSQAISILPDSPKYYEYRAEALKKLGRLDEALDDLETPNRLLG